MTPTDWDAIERDYRAGQISIRGLARQHGVSDTAIRNRAKAKGWTQDLSAAVRTRVREELVREGVRGCELAGIMPSDAAIVDQAAAIGVEVVRSHRRDIERLRQAAAGLLHYLDDFKPTERSRIIADLSHAMGRLIPLERQAFGLDEDKAPDPYATLSDGDLNRRIDALLAETRASEAARRTDPPPLRESTGGLPALSEAV